MRVQEIDLRVADGTTNRNFIRMSCLYAAVGFINGVGDGCFGRSIDVAELDAMSYAVSPSLQLTRRRTLTPDRQHLKTERDGELLVNHSIHQLMPVGNG